MLCSRVNVRLQLPLISRSPFIITTARSPLPPAENVLPPVGRTNDLFRPHSPFSKCVISQNGGRKGEPETKRGRGRNNGHLAIWVPCKNVKRKRFDNNNLDNLISLSLLSGVDLEGKCRAKAKATGEEAVRSSFLLCAGDVQSPLSSRFSLGECCILGSTSSN